MSSKMMRYMAHDGVNRIMNLQKISPKKDNQLSLKRLLVPISPSSDQTFEGECEGTHLQRLDHCKQFLTASNSQTGLLPLSPCLPLSVAGLGLPKDQDSTDLARSGKPRLLDEDRSEHAYYAQGKSAAAALLGQSHQEQAQALRAKLCQLRSESFISSVASSGTAVQAIAPPYKSQKLHRPMEGEDDEVEPVVVKLVAQQPEHNVLRAGVPEKKKDPAPPRHP